MTFPSEFPVINDISMSVTVNEVYSTSSDLLYKSISYTHTPFFVWLAFWLVISFVMGRLILEFIIKLRK